MLKGNVNSYLTVARTCLLLYQPHQGGYYYIMVPAIDFIDYIQESITRGRVSSVFELHLKVSLFSPTSAIFNLFIQTVSLNLRKLCCPPLIPLFRDPKVLYTVILLIEMLCQGYSILIVSYARKVARCPLIQC